MEQDSLPKRLWYVFLVMVLGTAYFIKAIAEGIWGWLKDFYDRNVQK